MGLKAMFVDIGFEKNAFLHFWDAIPAALDSGIEEIDRPDRTPPEKTDHGQGYSEYLSRRLGSDRAGDERADRHQRAARHDESQFRRALSGPHAIQRSQRHLAQNRRSEGARSRLRKILHQLEIPEGIGVIIRTVGEGQRARYFVRDLAFCSSNGRKIEQAIRNNPRPRRVFEEPDLVERTVRDFLTDEIDEVVCDDRAAIDRMNEMVGQISRRARNRIQFYDGAAPIFETFGVQKQIDDAFHRQVWLRCGGYIVIDETEALVAIDVNTGRNKGGRDVEKTILQTNLEAADEIARQLRLRNIGGLIIGDFIDMKSRKDQQAGLQPDEGAAEARQSQDPCPADFAARFDGDDAPARAGKPERFDLRKLSRIARAAEWSKPR